MFKNNTSLINNISYLSSDQNIALYGVNATTEIKQLLK